MLALPGPMYVQRNVFVCKNNAHTSTTQQVVNLLMAYTSNMVWDGQYGHFCALLINEFSYRKINIISEFLDQTFVYFHSYFMHVVFSFAKT